MKTTIEFMAKRKMKFLISSQETGEKTTNKIVGSSGDNTTAIYPSLVCYEIARKYVLCLNPVPSIICTSESVSTFVSVVITSG